MSGEEGRLEAGWKALVFDKVLLFTCVDYQKREGTFKFFDSWAEAETWEHDNHVKYAPEMHPKNCARCLKSRDQETK